MIISDISSSIDEAVSQFTIDTILKSTKSKQIESLLRKAFNARIYDKSSMKDFISHLQSMLKDGTCRGQTLSFFKNKGQILNKQHSIDSVVLQALYEIRYDINILLDNLANVKKSEPFHTEEPKTPTRVVDSEDSSYLPISPKKASSPYKKAKLTSVKVDSSTIDVLPPTTTLDSLSKRIHQFEKSSFNGMKKTQKFTVENVSDIHAIGKKISSLPKAYVVGVLNAGKQARHEFGFIKEQKKYTLYDAAAEKQRQLYRTTKLANLYSRITSNTKSLYQDKLRSITFSIYEPVISIPHSSSKGYTLK